MASTTLEPAVVEEAAKAVVAVPPTGDVAATVITAAGSALTPNAFIVHIAGYPVNLVSVLLIGLILGLLVTFFRIQTSKKLDFADTLSYDGRRVSLSKILQLVGGLASTWVIIKMAAVGTLSAEIFGVYLAYVGAVEGYTKYIRAKYGFAETAIRDSTGAGDANHHAGDHASVDATLNAAEASATTAENSAKAAKLAIKAAEVDLKTQ